MQENAKQPSAMAWVLSQTGVHKGQYVLSVVLAVLGVAFSVAPYFLVAGIVHALMAGEREMGFYLSRCAVMAVFWLLRVLCHALSTATSHRATFAVLGEIRKRATEKLTRMPLGAVMAQSSGALKSTLIERIDSIETTLAHIVPEFTANLLVPVVILVFIFTIDWRRGRFLPATACRWRRSAFPTRTRRSCTASTSRCRRGALWPWSGRPAAARALLPD